MWNYNTRKKIAIVLVLALAVGLMPRREMAYAAPGVPKVLNYQGRLLSATGTLLGGASGASYCFKFSLYDAVSSGSKVWPSGNPATSTITVTNGVFNAGIGDTSTGGDALDYNFQSTSTIFLEIQVGARGGDGNCNSGGDETIETLSPRQQVFSAGFAINSDTVDGFHAVEYATSTQVPVLSNGELILGSSTPSVSATGTNALTLQNRSSGNINFFSSATATLTTAGTLTIAGLLQSAATGNSYFSGNLGIGLTSPSTRLEVSGTASTTALFVSDLATTTQLYVGSSTIIVNNLTVDTDTFFVDAANGRVGIGTTTPAAKLDIDTGSNTTGLRLRGIAETVEIADIYVGSLGQLKLDTTAGTDTGAYIDLMSEDNQYGVIIRESDGTGITAFGNIYVVDGTPDYMTINVSSVQDGDALVITSDNNVGIGTATPAAKLDVAGTASSTGLVVSGIATTTNLNITSFTNGSILFTTSSGLVSQDNSNLFWDDTNNRLGIGTTTPQQRFSVVGTSTFSGNVGIGTSAPLSALHVAGTTGITQSAGSGGASGLVTIGTGGTSGGSLWVNTPGRDSDWEAGFAVNGAYTDFGGGSGESEIRLSAYSAHHAVFSSAMTFYTRNGTAYTEKMRIDKDGKIGIGTSTPQDALHVIGDIRTSACASDGTGDVACVDIAETYTASEAMEAGDVVEVDNEYPISSSSSFAVKKAEGGTTRPLIGIISTRPALLIEGDKARLGGPKVEGTYKAGEKAPVALAGRVPVKISEENGIISAGDKLTISSQKGVAKKATEAGWIAGVALQPSSHASSGKIMAFVNSVWWGGESASADTESASLLAELASAVRTTLESLGIFIQNGTAYIERLTTTYIEVTKAEIEEANIGVANIKHLRVENDVEFIDKATGEPYCAWLENGAWVRERGSCASQGEATPEAIPETTPETAPAEEETQVTSIPPDETIATSTPSEVESNNQ